MHASSGLTDEVRRSTVTVARGAGSRRSTTCVGSFPRLSTAPLCGNSIGTDRGFLATATWRELDEYLHYRMVDVSSIKELARRWFPRIYFGQPPKGLAHRALADIMESIEELAYYRRTMFVVPPGPSGADDRGGGDRTPAADRAPAHGRRCSPAAAAVDPAAANGDPGSTATLPLD